MDPKIFRLLLKYVAGEQIHDLKTHEQLCQVLLGDGYTFVHSAKDRPSKWLGKGHRVLFHDHATNLAIGLISGDYKAGLAAELHDALDFGETNMRKSMKPTRKR